MFMIDLGAESFYSTLGISPEATPQEVRMAHNRVTGEIERQRQRARTPEEKRARGEAAGTECHRRLPLQAPGEGEV